MKNKFNIGDLVEYNKKVGIIFDIKSIEDAKKDTAAAAAAALAALEAERGTVAAIQKDPRIYYVHFNGQIKYWDAHDLSLTKKLNK